MGRPLFGRGFFGPLYPEEACFLLVFSGQWLCPRVHGFLLEGVVCDRLCRGIFSFALSGSNLVWNTGGSKNGGHTKRRKDLSNATCSTLHRRVRRFVLGNWLKAVHLCRPSSSDSRHRMLDRVLRVCIPLSFVLANTRGFVPWNWLKARTSAVLLLGHW